MTVIRGNPADLKTPALKKEIVVKTVNGQLVASSWPRRRGKPKSPAQQEAIDWLKWSARVFPYIDGNMMDTAIDWTKGTGLYPRDLVTMAMKGSLANMEFEDGTSMSGRVETMECLVFNGAIIELDSDRVMASGVELFPDWPLPVKDTFSFWDAGAPDRLTVPVGVTVIRLNAGGRAVGAADTRFFCSIKDAAGTNIASSNSKNASTQTLTTSTGPIAVQSGDWFRAAYLVDSSKTLEATGGVYFSIEVLEAICPAPT